MPRLAAVLASVAVVSAGACLPSHAPVARRVGMVASVAGVLGLMASAAVQGYTDTDDMLTAFSIMSGGGIVVFAMGELSLPPKGARQETETEKLRRWARILTTRASGAAREGRCPRVRRLEKRVNVYDREIHDFVFMRDAAILKCLGIAPQLDPDAADPGADAPTPVLPTPMPVDPNPSPNATPPAAATPPADGTPPPDGTPPADGTSPPADANAPPTLPPPRPAPSSPPTYKLPPGTVLPPPS